MANAPPGAPQNQIAPRRGTRAERRHSGEVIRFQGMLHADQCAERQ
jgi:hypothetical protein